jgi:hypothetical protein
MNSFHASPMLIAPRQSGETRTPAVEDKIRSTRSVRSFHRHERGAQWNIQRPRSVGGSGAGLKSSAIVMFVCVFQRCVVIVGCCKL